MQDPSQAQPPQYPPSTYYPPTQSAVPYPPMQSGASYPPTQQGTPPQGEVYPVYTPPPLQAYPPQQPYPPPYGTGYPPPQKRQQPWLWAILGVLAAVIIVGAIVAVVAVNSRQSNTPTSTPSATQQANGTPGQSTPSSSGEHKIGDVVTLDGWQLVVNGAKISHGGEFDTPQHAGDVFLEIDVSVTNQTGQNQRFTGFIDFDLKDSTGQKYDQAFVSDAPSPPDGNVQNGGKLRGTLAYEVTPTVKSFEFDFSPSLGTTDIATWNITVP